ncbi:hypothetical protein VTJ83DRAFT_4441 [Remersonia thermophila]|uniref:Polynucleotide 5'-hydroxyl-kinase GRC3 n=1 Tax=Remersonia thermophila TaxID=72144 RepID=A0ABR4DC01_9PEZI
MSIPGLGQIAPPQPTTASATRTITLRPFWEYRFEVSRRSGPTTSSATASSLANPAASTSAAASTNATTIRLTTGKAERDGTELALNHTYAFPRGTRARILTYTGATLEVAGELPASERVAEYARPEDSPEVQVLNLHFALQEQRKKARERRSAGGRPDPPPGPRVLICGGPDAGKTTVARTLTGLATRAGGQPLVASLDPRDGMLALPGTVGAAVFGTVMDVEDPAGGFGVRGTPSSGPSAVPVKLPNVYYFGRERVEEDVPFWRTLAGRLGGVARAKLAADSAVGETGLVVDTPPASVAKGDVEMLRHAMTEFAANIVVVVGSPDVHAALQRAWGSNKTLYGEPVTFLHLDKSDGVVPRDYEFAKFTREAAIKEYFFGDAKRTLSPFTQSVGFDDLAIFKTPDDAQGDYDNGPAGLERAEISAEMSHWTLAVMNAAVSDPPETIRQAPVMGFVAVADVDEDRRRLKVLSPVSGRLGNRPLVWARWPEPYINLLG